MSLAVKGKAAHIAPRRRQSQGPTRRVEQNSRKTSVASSIATDQEANEISNLADQYAQSLQQQIQLLQIENTFLKQQEEKRETAVDNEKRRQLELNEQYRLERLREEQNYHTLTEERRGKEEKQLENRRESIKKRGNSTTTTHILARGNEVSLNGETWCQLPPYHPPIPAIISDRSQQSNYSPRGGRERSFMSESFTRDRREYSVPCFGRSRHASSGVKERERERSFVMSQSLEREESILQDLEEALERSRFFEKEIGLLRDRELENEKIISQLKLKIKAVEMAKKEETDSMTTEKKGLLEELLHMQKRIDELAPACAEKELKIVSIDNEKLELTKRLRSANNEISHLQTTIMHIREDVTSKDNEVRALNDEMQYLRSRILVIEEENRELRAKDMENQEKINMFIQQIREFELIKINDKSLIDKVMEENSNLIKENAKVTTKLNRMENVDYSSKQRELKEAQVASETVSELRTALQSERNSTHSLVSKIEILRQRCEDLEKSVIDRDKNEEENIAERNRVEKELSALHALSKSLTSENKVLRDEKYLNEEIIDELKGKIRALEAAVKSAQGSYQEKEKISAAKIHELEEEASKKHQKYLEFEEISKTLHQITSLLPSKTHSLTQPQPHDCAK